jgi:hypothetical protein
MQPPPPKAADSGASKKVYRASLPVTLWAVFSICFLLIFILSLIDPQSSLMNHAAWIAILLFVLCVVAWWYFVTEIHDWGIRGYDLFGLYRDIEWENISKVSTLPMWLFTTYINVGNKKGMAVTIPLFLSSYKEFREDLLTRAPEGNPLREFFAQR